MHEEQDELRDMLDKLYASDLVIKDGQYNRIVEAVIYNDEVFVKRRVQVQVEQGWTRILVELKAFDVVAESVQASVVKAGKLLSVQYRELPFSTTSWDEVNSLTDQRDDLLARRRVLDDHKSVLSKQKIFVDSLVAFADAELPRKVQTSMPDVDTLRAMLDFITGSFRECVDRERELDHRIAELDRDINMLDKRVKRLRRSRDEVCKVIEVLLDALAEGEVELEVGYVAANATWEPIYKVDVPLDLSQACLTMSAMIRQTTGENWNNVHLGVSSAIPMQGAILPDLESWELHASRKKANKITDTGSALTGKGRAVRRLRRGKELLADTDDDLDQLLSDTQDLNLPTSPEKEHDPRNLPEAFEYRLQQPVSLSSTDGETILPLFSRQIVGEYIIYTVPCKNPWAYLVCCAAADMELMPGQLNVFFGGRMVGSCDLEAKQVDQELVINLGVEKAIKIRRELIENDLSAADDPVVCWEVTSQIFVQNTKDHEVLIRLLDHIPVSKTDTVRISDLWVDPPPAEPNFQEREGVMLWNLTLGAGETQEVNVRFLIQHSRDYTFKLSG